MSIIKEISKKEFDKGKKSVQKEYQNDIISEVPEGTFKKIVTNESGLTGVTSIGEVLSFAFTNRICNEILEKHFKYAQERNEFKSFINENILLSEASTKSAIHAYENNYLNIWFAKIVSNNVLSYRSPWHTQVRRHKAFDYMEGYEIENAVIFQQKKKDYDDYLDENEYKDGDLSDIKEVVNNILNSILIREPLLYANVMMFKMHFLDKITFKEISKKTRVQPSTVSAYVNLIQQKVQVGLKEHYEDLNLKLRNGRKKYKKNKKYDTDRI